MCFKLDVFNPTPLYPRNNLFYYSKLWWGLSHLQNPLTAHYLVNIDIILSALVLSQPPLAQNTCEILLIQRARECCESNREVGSIIPCRYFLAFLSTPEPSQQELFWICSTAANSETSPRNAIQIGVIYGLLLQRLST